MYKISISRDFNLHAILHHQNEIRIKNFLMVELIKRFLTVPLIWLTPKECNPEEKTYELPEFIEHEESENDNNQSTQDIIEKENDTIDQLNDQEKKPDQIDWMELDEVEFLPSGSDLIIKDYYQTTENDYDQKIDDPKLKEKLILSIVTGHLDRYCEQNFKCSVDDLVLEFQKSNTSPDKNQQIETQKKIFKDKFDSLKSEHST